MRHDHEKRAAAKRAKRKADREQKALSQAQQTEPVLKIEKAPPPSYLTEEKKLDPKHIVLPWVSEMVWSKKQKQILLLRKANYWSAPLPQIPLRLILSQQSWVAWRSPMKSRLKIQRRRRMPSPSTGRC